MSSKARPRQEWWTAKELTDAGLIDMPGTVQNVNAMAERLNWRAYPKLARRRSGRGGGWEYHWTLLPSRTQAQLLAQVAPAAPPAPAKRPRDEAWAWFDRLPATVKARAQARLEAIQAAEALELGGLTRDLAVRQAARMHDCSARAIWNWMYLIEGVRADDRLPYLAPRHRLAQRKVARTVIDPEFADIFLSDWLRLGEPEFQACYDRAKNYCDSKGIPVPHVRTARRWEKQVVSEPVRVARRKGMDALKALFPPQIRDRSHMHALEGVNGDYHKFDVFVRFPAGGGYPEEVLRPQMVAFQDLRSNKVLAWRVARSANSHTVQLCLGDLIETWGIPKHVLLDNGREFAAKSITGGTPTRYRFKVKEDDVPGLLTTLGCEIHWATPFSGQSKPIERSFADYAAERVAKHPAFDGAYTGNRPDAKPENYASRAVPLEDFLKVLAEEITAYNVRPNRRSELAYGRSYEDVFAESYAQTPIRKATTEQRRLWLMGAEGVTIHSTHGRVTFMGNGYWDDWMIAHAGEKVVARFDAGNLWDGLHIYALTGEYLGFAPCQQKVKFFDVDEGRALAKARRHWMKAQKAAGKALAVYTAAEVATALKSAPKVPEPPKPEPKVVQMVPIARRARPEPPKPDPRAAELHAGIVADLTGPILDRQMTREADDKAEAYARVRELERRAEAGEALSREQARWVESFRRTGTYKAMRQMEEDFGETRNGKPPVG